MSAQAGVWNFDGKPVNQALLERFGSALAPYGPDGGNTYLNASIGMVYRAFHTTAESRLEQQPFKVAHRHVFTWDGRLDNREELIAELGSDLSRDCTDVSLVAAAYERCGHSCFRRLVGDWAVAIWDPQRRELVLAVDYLAVRHIFYYWTRSRVWWSTVLHPLALESEYKFHISDDYVAGYLAHDPDAHLTPYHEIHAIPPGHFARVNARGISLERFWRISGNIRYKTDAEYEEHFRHLFRQAVRRRLRSDSPILAELSGGLDSSAIVCMADHILAEQGAQTTPLDTLSYYNQAEPQGDDWIYFRKLEEKRQRVGAHIDAGTLESAPGPLAYPAFCALPGAVGIGRPLEMERARVVRQGGYRAVLSGLGGDELLGAIPNPSPLLADLILQCQALPLVRQLAAWSLIKRRPWIQLLCMAFLELLPASLSQYVLKQAKIESWVNQHFAMRTKMAVRQLDVQEHFGLCLPSRRYHIGGVLWIANKLATYTPPTLALEERRYPYLDLNLVQFLLAIPASQLLRPGERRSLQRRALAAIVPPEILYRTTKQFAARTPVIAVAKNWEELQTAFSSPISSRLGYIHPQLFLKKLQRAMAGEQIHIARMMKTISLEFWLRSQEQRGLLADIPDAPVTTAARSRIPAVTTSSATSPSDLVG